MPRSGTTLLSSMLAAHSRVTVTPESHFFRLMGKLGIDPTQEMAPDAVLKIFEHYRASEYFNEFRFSDRDIDHVRGALKALEAARPVDILSRLLELIARREQVSLVLEKTPDHAFFVAEIKRAYPDAKIAAIVRDPRDVSLSLDRVAWGRGGPLWHALRWRRSVRAVLRDRERLGADAFRVIRYEDLLADPRAPLDQLCDLFDLAFEDRMLTWHDQRPAHFDPASEPWKNKALGKIDADNTNKWRHAMKPSDLVMFDLVLGEELRRFGYEKGCRTTRAAQLALAAIGVCSNIVRMALVAPGSIAKHVRYRLTAIGH